MGFIGLSGSFIFLILKKPDQQNYSDGPASLEQSQSIELRIISADI